MNENETETAAAAAETAAPKKKTKKKAAKKTKAKAKAKGAKKGGGGGGRKLYSLRAGVDLSKYDKKTHEGAVVHALKKLGEATIGEIREQAKKDGFKTDMKAGIEGAISFAAWDLSTRQDVVKTRPKPKEEKKKAA